VCDFITSISRSYLISMFLRKNVVSLLTHIQIPVCLNQTQRLLFFNFHGFVHRKNILIYIQQDATLHSLFYLENTLHVSGGGTTLNM